MSALVLCLALLSGVVHLVVYAVEESWRRTHYKTTQLVFLHTPWIQILIYGVCNIFVTSFLMYAALRFPIHADVVIVGSLLPLCYVITSIAARAMRTSGHAVSGGVRTAVCLVILCKTDDAFAFVASLLAVIQSVNVPPRAFHSIQ